MSNEAGNSAPDLFDEASAPEQARRKLQLVRAGSSQFGVFADEIATIVAWRKPTPLPNAPRPVLGVVSVQGRMLTVLDLASLPTGETAQSEKQNEAARNAATRASNSASPVESSNTTGSLIALRGDEQLALAVAEVGESIELTNGEFAALPKPAGELISGVLQRDGTPIKILNLRELFPTAIQGRERRRRRF